MAAPLKFDFLNVDLSGHKGDLGTDFVIKDTGVLSVLLLNAKCGEYGHPPLKLAK